MTNYQLAIKDIFTKLGKEIITIWFSGKRGEGEYKLWHENGQLKEHSFWKNGRLNGERKRWHENGQLAEHSNWKDNDFHGEITTWASSGRLIQHSLWKVGKKVKDIK